MDSLFRWFKSCFILFLYAMLRRRVTFVPLAMHCSRAYPLVVLVVFGVKPTAVNRRKVKKIMPQRHSLFMGI